jgi:uncharacterized membrane protein YhiD involved in acid resistance
MTNQFAESVPYVAGAATALIGVVGQADVSFWLQAGMAGVVVLLLLKFFPMLMKHLEEKDKRHEETIRNIVERNEKKDEAWQKIVSDRGICPVSTDNQNQQ